MSMHEHDGLAGLAAREATHHPAPETSELERLRAEVSLLQHEARIRQAINDGLSSEVAQLRACVPPVHPADYGHEAWAEAVRAAVTEERAAVVAWLRAQRLFCTDSTGTPNAVSATYAHAAEAIERGEHREK